MRFAVAIWGALSQSQIRGHTDDVIHFQIIDLDDGSVRVIASREAVAYNAFGSVLSRATFTRYDPDTRYDPEIEQVLEAAKSNAEAESPRPIEVKASAPVHTASVGRRRRQHRGEAVPASAQNSAVLWGGLETDAGFGPAD
jgi:hypothetical protein